MIHIVFFFKIIECFYISVLLQDAIKEYERSMSEMVAGFLEYMQGQMSQCRELENIHHERLLEAAVALLEKQMKNELDDQISDDLRDVSTHIFIPEQFTVKTYLALFGGGGGGGGGGEANKELLLFQSTIDIHIH